MPRSLRLLARLSCSAESPAVTAGQDAPPRRRARSVGQGRTAAGLACGAALLACAGEVRADPLDLSLSIERAAGVAVSNLHPSGSDSVTVTTATLAGAAVNPIALPRLGFDVVLPSGLTLGTGLAAGYATLSQSPNGGGQGASENGAAWLVSPRIGYRFRLGPLFDLTPRAGFSFAGGSVGAQSTSEACTYSPAGVASCTTTPSTSSASLFFGAISVDVALALRLTSSFNLLAGVSLDDVVAASGSSSSPGQVSNSSQSVNAAGSYVGGQLWLGLGGYL